MGSRICVIGRALSSIDTVLLNYNSCEVLLVGDSCSLNPEDIVRNPTYHVEPYCGHAQLALVNHAGRFIIRFRNQRIYRCHPFARVL